MKFENLLLTNQGPISYYFSIGIFLFIALSFFSFFAFIWLSKKSRFVRIIKNICCIIYLIACVIFIIVCVIALVRGFGPKSFIDGEYNEDWLSITEKSFAFLMLILVAFSVFMIIRFVKKSKNKKIN